MKRTRTRPRWFVQALLLLAVSFTFSHLSAQDIEISGKITDESANGLLGATITEKGTSKGIIVNLDGDCNIPVSGGSTINFSFVGYLARAKSFKTLTTC